MTPHADTIKQPSNTSGDTTSFWVYNWGTCAQGYDLWTTATGPISSVTLDKTRIQLNGGTGTYVKATYNTGPVGSGSLTLTAYGSVTQDNGRYTVTVVPPYSVAVTPDGGNTAPHPPNTGGYSETFTVQNTGYYSDTYTITCAGFGPVTCTGTSTGTLTLGSGASQMVTGSYTVGSAGTGSLTVRATSANATDGGSYIVPVTLPPGAPVVDLTPFNYKKQDYALCTHTCFATVYVQSTVPYFSWDTPRSVFLAYNSDRVNPKPFVHVNVSPDPNYGQTPTEYRLQVRVNGAFVTFLNGDQTLRFAYPGAGTARLGAQFDASSYTTGAYPMDVVVTALYAGGPITNDVVTKLVVVNERSSPIAAGWTLERHLFRIRKRRIRLTSG